MTIKQEFKTAYVDRAPVNTPGKRILDEMYKSYETLEADLEKSKTDIIKLEKDLEKSKKDITKLKEAAKSNTGTKKTT